ncbi:MAG: hypothetical protein PWQ39_616 [Thermacetogenium sp.]|nr:hypothetical protein [Thermacetogenium sp.]
MTVDGPPAAGPRRRGRRATGRGNVNIIKILSGERGTALVLVAFALVVILGCASLVTDIGLVYTTRTRLINTADAAALAGVQELPGEPERAREVAEEYAAANGISPEELVVEVAADRRSLTVRPHRQVQFLFARVLGFTGQDVEAAATAVVAPLTGASGVVPFSIEEQELEFGREYVLKEGAGNGPAQDGDDGKKHGWYGALDLDNSPGGGADDYRERVKNGYPGLLRVGDRVLTEAGNMSGPTTEAVNYRIGRCREGCTFENAQRGCPRVVIVPVVRVVEWQGNHPKEVEIRGFAAFFLEGVGGQGKDNYVAGRFIRTVASGELTEEMQEGQDYGLYGVRLVH